MTEAELYGWVVGGILAAGLLSFASLQFVVAPYGRHIRGGWGPTLPDRVGWILMESPAVFLFLAVYGIGEHRADRVPLLLLALWMLHYLYRTLIYPWRTDSSGKRMPIAIVGMGFVFNSANAAVNARWLSQLGPSPGRGWVGWWLVAGVVLFLAGWLLNQTADATLLRMRRERPGEYRIPRGGAYRWVSCPNYLGEILEWFGFALAAWSPAGLAFALFTVANLAPRAGAHHRWYRERFPEYPPERRALIPFVY